MTRTEMETSVARLAILTGKPLHLERYNGKYRIQETIAGTTGQRHYSPNMTKAEMSAALELALTIAADFR